MDQLRPLAADLIARKVAVIAAVGGNNTGLVAKTLTSMIPIVFTSGLDPVKAGLVASLSRPGANVTGVSWFSAELAAQASRVAAGTPSASRADCPPGESQQPRMEHFERSARDGARALGMAAACPQGWYAARHRRGVRNARRAGGERRHRRADPFLSTRSRQLVIVGARHALPLMSSVRELPVAGGLISYGNSVTDAIAEPDSTSAASSKARSQPTCRSSSRPNSSLSSISRPPRRSASTFRRPCSPAPTR